MRKFPGAIAVAGGDDNDGVSQDGEALAGEPGKGHYLRSVSRKPLTTFFFSRFSHQCFFGIEY